MARRIRITGDAEPVLAAASPKNWGIALISGTGSFAWGRNAQGQTARAGGWGYLMGDEGSAYALVLAGLRAAARAADGRGPATELLASFQQRLDAPTPADLIERVYGAEMTREKIADLAAVVFETAGNDPVSGRIVESALDDLVLLVSTLAERLALPPGTFPLALAGGVLLNQDRFRVELVRRLGLEPDTVSLVMEPVRGAVVLARMELDSGIET